ncbi:hypothetical protein IFM89_009731 [Coptis chinensis]|uniref:Uncharacterized protein n=1 Tax=Coptis chinensis TaxID=261450 RepID=A0A835HGE2_9MAGN|nr:hypothetical protein IFM89_009731 [Coptis chinensis]
MNFSEEWKSLWTINSVYSPPLLITKPSSKQLGPLLFTPSPKPQTKTTLLSSPFLSSPFTIPPFSSSSKSHSQQPQGKKSNNLQLLKCSKTDFLLFFPTGDDLNRVGFVKLVWNGSKFDISDSDDDLMTTEHEFDDGLCQISVSAVSVDDFEAIGNSVIGYLLASCLDTVHLYRVEIRNSYTDFEKPVLAYLGSKEFDCRVVHACWSPHLPEECLVLLETGDLFLFDMEGCVVAEEFPVDLEGTRIGVLLERFELDENEEGKEKKDKWLSCAFSWHPRIFIVACSTTVCQVDWRFEENDVSVLVKDDMFHLNSTVEDSQFIAFGMAGSDGFHFAVATENHLFLIDIRRPMMPVLQWAHDLHKPDYINVFKLSELRTMRKEDKYEWASDSGFAILLGSFLNFKFCIFCYGPPLPVADGSVALQVSKFCNSLYAWELPSELSVLGRQCSCGDCLLREDLSNEALPEWKKERVLGFSILGGDVSDRHPESDGCSGFTLIRLVSSGKLELQKYVASWDSMCWKLERSSERSSHVDDSLLSLFVDQPYRFPRRFRYLRIDSLLGYMNGDLPKVLMSKMKKSSLFHSERPPLCTQDSYDLVSDILKAAGVDRIGFCPRIEDLLNGISCPMNMHEIASSRMWGGLNVDLLQLAFTFYSELTGVLVEHRKIPFEALDIPTPPQLPPFFSKKPTSRSSKWKPRLRNIHVGPVLPLPYLLTLQKVEKKKNSLVLEEEESESSAEDELAQQCKNVMMVASKTISPKCHSEPNNCPPVSIANEVGENCVRSQELKPLFFHKPCASSEKIRPRVDSTPQKPLYEDEKFDTFISRTSEKVNSSDTLKEPVGLDFFDDMCPVKLNFDFPEMTFGAKELKGYKSLKRQFSNWARLFHLHGDDQTQYWSDGKFFRDTHCLFDILFDWNDGRLPIPLGDDLSITFQFCLDTMAVANAPLTREVVLMNKQRISSSWALCDCVRGCLVKRLQGVVSRVGRKLLLIKSGNVQQSRVCLLVLEEEARDQMMKKNGKLNPSKHVACTEPLSCSKCLNPEGRRSGVDSAGAVPSQHQGAVTFEDELQKHVAMGFV